jgi:2,4-dienoyl-CoA reductase-like NADH-dependent reductase (Old Yellow Enzyme family)
MSLDALLKPFEFKSLKLPNRVVMAPMTRSFSPGGVATDDVAAYYRRRAEGQVGLIVTEGTGVARPASLNDANVPRFHGEEELAAWKTVVEEVHAAGGLIAPQLWHVGAARGKDVLGKVDSPSGLSKAGGNPFTEPMTDELHGAHGYLIDQFFWNGTNVRGDHLNGPTIAERSKFAAEILKAVRAAVGPDYPVIIRLSQWKQQDYAVKNAQSPQEMEAWLQPLADAGADIFHCSQRRFWEPEFEGSDLNFAGWAKKLTGAPTITVGSVGLSGEFIAAFGGEGSQPASIDGLLERLERGEFDLVGVGRALLQDPEWVVKIRDGRQDELKNFEREALGVLY